MVIQMSWLMSVYSMFVGSYTGMHSPYRFYSKADAEIAVYSEAVWGKFQLGMGWPPTREYLGVQIVLLDIEKKQKTLIQEETHSSQAIISPKGTQVAWIAGEHGQNKELKVYDRATKAIRVIPVQNEAFQQRLNWTPDGKSLIYTTLNSIVFHPLGDGETFSLQASNPRGISISPDAKFLLYWQDEDEEGNEDWTLFRYDLEKRTTITNANHEHGKVLGAHFMWVPDGSKFLAWRFEADGEDFHPRKIFHHLTWVSKDLEPLGLPKENPTLIRQDLYPWKGELDISYWLEKEKSEE